MKTVIKFLALPWHRRQLVGCSVLLMLFAKLGLAALPFHSLLRLHDRFVYRGLLPRLGICPTPEQIAWAVTRTGYYIPGGRNCLLQAIAATALLTLTGHESRLCIGVARNHGHPLEAHAWVELGDRPVIGVMAESRYTLLWAWDGRGR